MTCLLRAVRCITPDGPCHVLSSAPSPLAVLGAQFSRKSRVDDSDDDFDL